MQNKEEFNGWSIDGMFFIVGKAQVRRSCAARDRAQRGSSEKPTFKKI